MTDTMNHFIKEQVRVALARRDMKQSELADNIGRSRQQINNVLKRDSGQVASIWLDIFNELDLELIVVPKNKMEKIKEVTGN